MMMRSVLASLFLVFGTAHALSFVLAPFVQEIKDKLADREDVSRISEYFSMTVKELTETLPVNDDQGNKNSYTFFAPTTAAFQRQLPQDIGDPFMQDAEFRKMMLLRHFARQAVTKDDLKKLTELKMGDTKTAKITQQGDVNMINEGEIMSDVIELGSDLGVIYIVDRVFVTPEEVSEIIAKYPSQPWTAGFVAPEGDEPDEALPVLGGYVEIKVDDPDVKEIANFATEALASAANSGPVKLVEVKAAAKQIVAGANYKLALGLVKKTNDEGPLTCEVQIFDPLPSDNSATRTLTEFHCVPAPARAPSSRLDSAKESDEKKKITTGDEPKVGGHTPAKIDGSKASSSSPSDAVDEDEPSPEPEPEPESPISVKQILGGYKSVSVDDPTVKEMATFAATAIASKRNSEALKVVEITSAATQVVAGTNYKLKLKLVDAASNDSPQTCEVTIWDQPWSPPPKLTNYECDADGSKEAARETRQALLGGYHPAKVDDPDVLEIASFAMEALAAKTNAGPAKLIKITSAAKQVVAGLNYKLVLQLEKIDSNGDGPLTCEVVVFDPLPKDPSHPTRILSQSSCGPTFADNQKVTKQ